jgi:serine/threonine protein phosphatase PrpC
MSYVETATATESYRNRCEDRIAVFNAEKRTVIVVADGAGGVGSGDVAAETVVREIKDHYVNIHSADQWAEMLRQIDCRLPAGESTAVVVDLQPNGMAGASVGDSQAWIIGHGHVKNLTENQNRKPLLGSGCAVPVSFTHSTLVGVLLIGTDGFFNYVKREAVSPIVAQTDFYSLPRTCIETVRLPSGELWDDVAIAAARIPLRSRTRKRYEI